MFHIILYQPEIPPNTGNIIRLCANSASYLHIIEPMKFELTNKHLKRAGLDYHDLAKIFIYKDFDLFLNKTNIKNIYACSTKGKNLYHDISYILICHD